MKRWRLYPTPLIDTDMTMEGRDSEWTLCGTKGYHTALVFLYISIITCFINLMVGNSPNELWISILSLSIGTILPSSKVHKTLCSIPLPTILIVHHPPSQLYEEAWPRGKRGPINFILLSERKDNTLSLCKICKWLQNQESFSLHKPVGKLRD